MGMMSKWLQNTIRKRGEDVFPRSRTRNRIRTRSQENAHFNARQPRETKAFTLEDLYSVFAIWFVGMLLSGGNFVGEIVFFFWNRHFKLATH